MLIKDIKKYYFEINLAFHVLFGALCTLIPGLVVLWVLYVIFYRGTYLVFRNKNKFGHAHLAAAYIGSMEMIVRMSKTGLPHEMTKYAIILILLNGLFFRPKIVKQSLFLIIYFILLTPSIFLLNVSESLEEARQSISFNLSGPLCLAIASIYFFRRQISNAELISIFQSLLLPLASIIGWLFVKTPNISNVEFGFYANFSTSGYGPNQMASVLGLGILIIGVSFLFKKKVFQFWWIGLFFLGALAYRGLLTFSRGGMVAPIIIIAFLIIFFTFSSMNFRKKLYKIFSYIIIGLIGVGITYFYVNSATGNALYNRYVGISYGKKVNFAKYASGRTEIFKIDLQIFADHPFFGIGPGMGNDMRVLYGYVERAAAHIEFTRMLAEHGIFGVFALVILFLTPWVEFRKRKTLENRFLLITGTLFCFSFMLHSATRIALPMFMYGLAFVYIIPNSSHDPILRQQTLPARRLSFRN